MNSKYKTFDQEVMMSVQQMTMNNGRVREPGVLAATSLKFNLEEEIRQLQAEPRWQAGHTGKDDCKICGLPRCAGGDEGRRAAGAASHRGAHFDSGVPREHPSPFQRQLRK